MFKKTLAATAVAAFLVAVPGGAAMAQGGADDPVPGCHHGCDNGPNHH